MSLPKSYAILPAAGESVRMGSPKLMLPLWGMRVIDHVLKAWATSLVSRVIIVVRANDVSLRDACRIYDVDVITPKIPPRDMKASVQIAVNHISQSYAPEPDDAWLLAPADMPSISTKTIDLLIRAYGAQPGAIVLPTYHGQRGHPLISPWSLAKQVATLGDNQGIRDLLTDRPLTDLIVPDPGIAEDLDDAADYQRLCDAERQADLE